MTRLTIDQLEKDYNCQIIKESTRKYRFNHSDIIYKSLKAMKDYLESSENSLESSENSLESSEYVYIPKVEKQPYFTHIKEDSKKLELLKALEISGSTLELSQKDIIEKTLEITGLSISDIISNALDSYCMSQISLNVGKSDIDNKFKEMLSVLLKMLKSGNKKRCSLSSFTVLCSTSKSTLELWLERKNISYLFKNGSLTKDDIDMIEKALEIL